MSLEAAVEKMRREGIGDAGVETFAHYYERLRGGETGTLPEAELEPVTELPSSEDLPPDDDAPFDEAVVIKLNGGLGTGMGLDRAKSLLEVKDGLTFLDVAARQVLALRERTGARLPLVLMDSFRTQADSLAALDRYEALSADLPRDFLQGKVPKLLADSLAPAAWPADPTLEWAPPGHGDLYTALVTSGVLEAMLDRGYRWAFVSNSDNLGATLDPRMLAYMAQEEIPFLMEVADRTPADRKGGHLARRRDGGRLVLREIAQTPDEDVEAFQDVSRHRFFNTNTIWLDLEAVSRERVLGLPMIVNRKTVDPADEASPAVVQLETAMGAAIDVFAGARALRVPRARLVPVKTTNDLLVVRSDAYALAEDGTLRAARERPPVVDLDPDHYKLLPQFEARFPFGPPSLRECERLTVRGDVTFGRGVVVRGDVVVEGVERVDDGTSLGGH